MQILIDGPDRTFKTTTCDRLLKLFPGAILLRSPALPRTEAGIYYNNLFNFLSTYTGSIIMDRAYLGEYVYSQLYRGYNGEYIFELEKKFNNDIDRLHVLMLDEPEKILARDDGKSQFVNLQDIEEEIVLFKTAIEMSSVKNKIIVNVGDEDYFEQILSKIGEYIK